jgi:uncharacterized protein YqiB (DUF1249 family)
MKRRRPLNNSTPVHEANYAKLQRVMPTIETLEGDLKYSSQSNGHHVEIHILEKTKYTTAFSLTFTHASMRRWVPEIFMKVRTYHDAKVAEVLNFQRHGRFASLYDYPNQNMFQANEKQQINRFFSEWLDHCLNSRLVFDDEFETVNA